VLGKQKLLARGLPGDLGEAQQLINMDEGGREAFETDESPSRSRPKIYGLATAFVDVQPRAAPSKAIAMLGLPLALLTFLIALVAAPFVGMA
jgi:hypothetical protein